LVGDFIPDDCIFTRLYQAVSVLPFFEKKGEFDSFIHKKKLLGSGLVLCDFARPFLLEQKEIEL
jgi:hypothetical protein